jgi:electron transfer flavoprotein beta subunit
MKILVPVKRAASLDDEFEMRADGRDVDPDFCEWDINEFDEYSVEEAIKIKEAAGAGVEVVVMTVGPEDADDVLRKALAKGADRGIRVWDDAVEDSDQIVIARIIAKVVEREQPDLVLAGAQSSDHGFAQTGIAVAGILGWPHAAVVSALEFKPGDPGLALRRELEGGLEEVFTLKLPAVLTIQLGINRPRYASLRGIKQAGAKPVEELSHGDLGLSDDEVGEAGSLSRVRRMYAPERGQGEMLKGTPAEQARRILEIVKEVRGL